MRKIKISNLTAIFLTVLTIAMCNASLLANQFQVNVKENVLIKHSDANYIELSFFPEFSGFDTILVGNKKYLKPNLKNANNDNNAKVGEPNEIMHSVVITVPDENSFVKTSHNVVGVINHFGMLAPTPKYFFDDDLNSMQYEFDDEIYSQKQLSEWVTVEYLGIAGSRHIAKVSFVAARYNAKNTTIEIPKEINVVINFNTNKKTIPGFTVKNDFEVSINHNETRCWIIERNFDRKFSNEKNTVKDNEVEPLKLSRPITLNGVRYDSVYFYMKLDKNAKAFARMAGTYKAFLGENHYYIDYQTEKIIFGENIFQSNSKSKSDNSFQSSDAISLDEISDGDWLKLGINNEGVHIITASDLASQGVNIPKDKVNTIKIFGQSGKPISEKLKTDLSMNEQEIIVQTNADGSLDRIIFYASAARGFEYDSVLQGNTVLFKRQRHYRNYYDNRNYYLLTYGKTEGKRAIQTPTPAGEVKYKPTSYRASLFVNEDKFMPKNQSMGLGLYWFGSTMDANPIVRLLPNFNRTGNVEFLLSVGHTNPVRSSIKIFQGNDLIVNEFMDSVKGTWTSAYNYTYNRSIPASQIGTDNRCILRFEYGGSPLFPFHNFYEIHYQSDLVPIENEITFYSDIVDFASGGNEAGITEYSINGFTSASGNTAIYGFDVSDMSNPKLLENIANTGGFFIFRAEESPQNVKKYFIASKTNFPSIEKISLLNLRNTNDAKLANADIIVITPDEFISSANRYAEYRSKQSNYKVSVVPIKKIYDEFSYGRLDLGAVRDYIQYCYENWENPPTYIVLWGTGHYDFRGIEKDNPPNFIPAHQRTIGNYSKEPLGLFVMQAGSGNFTTDDFFVNIRGNDAIPDIAIGRVPISSNSQGNNYIDKLDLYENNSSPTNWRRNVVLLADDGPAGINKNDGASHTRDCENVYRNLPKDFIMSKIYGGAYPTVYLPGGERRQPKATEEILNQINIVGTSAFLYAGHGNTNTLTHERVFARDLIQQLTNTDKLFFFLAASCEVGRFDHARGTFSADIVLQPRAGAIASFAASRISGPSANIALTNALMNNLIHKNSNKEYNSIGIASLIAKSKPRSDTSGPPNNNEDRMYILMGDPSLKLAFPDLTAKIEIVNDTIYVDNITQSVELKAMDFIKMKGKIISDITGELQHDFNGIVHIMLNEPKESTTVIDEFGTPHTFIKNGATLNSATYKVENGEFIAEFIIPSDISFSDKNSLLYLYAASIDNRYAKGLFEQILINDIATSIPNDNEGPEITIKLDNERFVSGDMVSKNPLLMVTLWDETALNTAGLGIGKKIEAWIDDSPNPIDLTPNFVSSLTDHRGGEVRRILYGLPAGRHKISVRAWDIFNNYTIATTYFVIPKDKEETILGATFVPNPANSGEELGIGIEYNVPPPIAATVTIFDINGGEVATFDEQIYSTGYAIIPWNGRNKSGELLSPGTYYYRINFNFEFTRNRDGTFNSRSSEKFGTLGIVTK